MNKHQLSSRLIWSYVALSFLIAAKPTLAAETKSGPSKKDVASDKFFESSDVPHIRIEIPEEGLTELKKYQWQFGPQTERENVKVTIREGGKVLTNVAVHLKGAAGSFRSVTENPAMTLNFDKFVDGQHFHGLSKLSLNNSVQDSTFLSEQFCREMFLKAGVAAPRATHATVELNGRDLGLYVLVEGFNKQFLKRHFKNANGNLYDGGFIKDVTDELSVNAGEKPKDQSDRIALAEAAKEPDLAKRLARLEKTLDINQFLSFLAMDVMLWDWDGYPLNKNNWRLFHDLSTGKMVFIPHGLDQMFWKPEGSILPPMKGLVANAVLEIPELRTRYFDRIKELRGSVYNVEAMTNRVQQIAAKVAPVLKKKNPDAAKEQTQAVSDFCDAIVRRARSIDRQLATPMAPVKFDDSGIAMLSHWEPKSDFGHPVLTRDSVQDVKEALRLGTTAGSSVGSWRSKMWLERGRYRVEGKVKTRGIVPDIGDSRGGTGLRLANGRIEKYVQATSDWTMVSNEFAVSDPLGEVEILCEFRGAEGEAWFDPQSIKLSRLQTKAK